MEKNLRNFAACFINSTSDPGVFWTWFPVMLIGKLCAIVFSPKDELIILIQNADTNLTDYDRNICLYYPQNLKSRAFGR
jgi:hypothetical protein